MVGDSGADDRLSRVSRLADDSGRGWSLEQTRDHNEVNEITYIDETTGSSWGQTS